LATDRRFLWRNRVFWEDLKLYVPYVYDTTSIPFEGVHQLHPSTKKRCSNRLGRIAKLCVKHSQSLLRVSGDWVALFAKQDTWKKWLKRKEVFECQSVFH
jgi:hypothetical protein